MSVSMCLSMADQNFERTKSLGILNLTLRVAESLARSPAVESLTVLANRSLHPGLLPRVRRQNYTLPARSRLGRILWDQTGCYRAAGRTGAGWLFLPKGFASFVRRPPMKLAVYVHDTVHDFYARRFPDPNSGFEDWYFAQALTATLRDARLIFTNTEFVRGEVLRAASERGLTPPKVIVAGIGFHAGEPGPDERKNQVIVLVSRWKHKRSDLALAFLERWRQASGWNGEIHVVGELPEGLAIPAGPNWRRHGRMSEALYGQLFATARALIYFSEYEGFGMPPVEAACAGLCPVFSDIPATAEVMGTSGCSYQNESFASFAAAMDRALATSPETIRAWARELQARHAWPRVTERIVRALETEEALPD